MLPEIGLAKGACTLWQEDLLLDYTIEVEDEQFRVHKLVMASVSDYFKAMLTGGMVESREDRVKLEGLSSLAVRNVIEFVYTGQFGYFKASAEECLACAVYLQIPAAVKTCTTSLCEEVNKGNCFHILSLFKSYTIADGIEYTFKFMKHNIEEILDDCNSADMTHEEFLSLMDCWEKSEWQLFVMAMQWLKKEHEQRKKHVNEIMSRIRFCLMSPTELAFISSMKEMGMISDLDDPWYDLVEKALKYNDLPTHQKVLEESEQSKVRTEPSPLCFGVHPSLSGQLFTIHKGKSWIRYDTVNPPVCIDDHNKCLECESIMVNNFFIVCVNSGEHAVQCSVFDPRTLSWSAMASMGIPREKCALVYHENHLYALGGYDRREEDPYEPTDVIEKYDFRTNTWSVITSKMPVELFDFDAFSIGRYIYIPGGWTTEVDFSNTHHCFDPEASEWSEKVACIGETDHPRVYVEIDGEKVIANIDEDLKLHYYKPSVDKWLVYDRYVPSKLKYDEIGALLATGNTIYLVGYVRDEERSLPDSSSDDDDEPSKDVKKVPHVFEKWTFDENGLRVDSEISKLRDYPNFGWSDNHLTGICALLSITPPSVRRGSAALP